MKKFWLWLKSLWSTTYTIQVSYDNVWGNEDDKIYKGVQKIHKQNFKELHFTDSNKNLVVIRGSNGLKYIIEVE
jgi:hypothetical protein